jgi:hypothetical protein
MAIRRNDACPARGEHDPSVSCAVFCPSLHFLEHRREYHGVHRSCGAIPTRIASATITPRMVTSSGLPVRAAAILPGLEERERLKMRKLKLSVLLCLSAAVFIIVRRPKKNHPESSKLDGTFSIEEDCSWLNHGGFAYGENRWPLLRCLWVPTRRLRPLSNSLC